MPAVNLGMPALNVNDLKELKNRPAAAQKEIKTVFEALAYLAVNFTADSGNLKTKENEISWEFSKPAEYAIEDETVNCAAAANVIKYLPQDDYQEVGYYWTDTDGRGGHVINYVISDGDYYFFDPVSITNQETKFPVENGDFNQRADPFAC